MAWKDIDISFEMKNDGDIADMSAEYAINNSLTNIFLTLKGSRRMLQPFASSIHYLLFEPIDSITAESIGFSLLDAIETWETRIDVININVSPKADTNTYVITLTYIIINDGTSEATYTFETILRAI